MRQHKARVVTLIRLPSIKNSKKTAKTGEVKLRTMRSPMGMRGMAARQVRPAADINRP